jgi:hypothetical protein
MVHMKKRFSAFPLQHFDSSKTIAHGARGKTYLDISAYISFGKRTWTAVDDAAFQNRYEF